MVDTADDDVDPTLRVSAEHERARALAEVLRHQEEKAEATRRAEARRRRRERMRAAVVVLAWLAAAWVWVLPPSWARIGPPEPPTLAEEARALRFRVYLQVEAIEAYRRTHGRLPDVLAEAGPRFTEVGYVRVDSRRYELEGRSSRVLVRYVSDEPPKTFARETAGLFPALPGGEGS